MALNFLQQQARFDQFLDCYNRERPHQALGMKYPAELYQPSARPYHGLDELHYPFHDRTITVTQCGRICFGRRKINLSTVLAGQNVGVKQVDDKIWLASFMDYDPERKSDFRENRTLIGVAPPSISGRSNCESCSTLPASVLVKVRKMCGSSRAQSSVGAE